MDEEVETFALLKRADKKRFGNLQIKLKNAYLLGRNEYPKTVQELTKILKNYEQEWPVQGERLQRQRNNGTTLLQEGQAGNDFEFLKGTTGTFFAHITCTACNKKGHYKSHCPVVDSEGILEELVPEHCEMLQSLRRHSQQLAELTGATEMEMIPKVQETMVVQEQDHRW